MNKVIALFKFGIEGKLMNFIKVTDKNLIVEKFAKEKGYIKIEEERLKIIQKKKKSLLMIKQEVIDCGLYMPERHINRK